MFVELQILSARFQTLGFDAAMESDFLIVRQRRGLEVHCSFRGLMDEDTTDQEEALEAEVQAEQSLTACCSADDRMHSSLNPTLSVSLTWRQL